MPEYQGIHTARAGDLTWLRDPGESEARFLGRARAEAHAAGFKIVFITGAVTAAATVVRLRGDEPPGAA